MTVREEMTPPATRPLTRVRGRLERYASLLRVKQWVKNGFVMAGLFFSNQLFENKQTWHALTATAAFCLVSSAVYCFNDLKDREADAVHPTKRNRPLVDGSVSAREAVGLIVGLLVLAAALLAVTSLAWQVSLIIGVYLVVNVFYSVGLKHIALVDVVVIASGFVLRLEAGIYAVEVPPSSWIVLTTGLLSLFLALGKRRGDLALEQATDRRSLSGYTIGFLDQTLTMMAAATVVLYALFTVSDYALGRFHAEHLYLTTFPVVVGFLRYLQLIIVEGKYASPAEVVLRDRPLQLVLVVWLALFFLLVYV